MMHFCSLCHTSIPEEDKICSKRQCIKHKAKICDLALFSIGDRLKQLYGKGYINLLVQIIENNSFRSYRGT